MRQVLDNGESVYFGQSVTEVEELFSCKAVDLVLPKISRPGIDKVIKLKNVTLRFDSGRLLDIQFEHPYQFINPPTPYPEKWKNFEPIGKMKIFGGMSRDEFLIYLNVWEERVKSLGMEKTNGSDRTQNQYSTNLSKRDEFMDSIHISLGSARRTGGHGRWSDGWNLSFATDYDHKRKGMLTGSLKRISAFRDEFNTMARHIMNLSSELPPHGASPWTSKEA
jgi:hypothetical protein